MFYKTIHTRMKYLFLGIILILLLIIIKVFYIQVFSYKNLNTLANGLWQRNLPIKADRGIIYDRNGKELATNITTTSLILIPNQIKNKEEVSTKLADILNVSYDTMYKHVTKKTSINRVHPEGRKLSYEIAQKINNLEYDGVYLVKESERYSPYKELLSHSLGYTGIDNLGLSGLELMYDSYLTGNDGAIKFYSDGKGNKLKLEESYNSPRNGMNITLTIDLDLQLAVERELNNIVSMYSPESALILASDPNTGEILAMGSRPAFDPNNYQNYNIETINRNLPIWSTYEPGSTFKIITLASSINENTINLFEDHYYDNGSITVENARIKCWKHGGHGSQTILEVVQNSCNPGFVVMGQKLGTERLYNYINKFGFGKKTGIDLNGEGSGILFSLEKMGPVETATTAFGQGVSVTPIQQVNAVSAAVNGGTLLKPYIVKSINEPENNTIIYENKKTEIRNVITSKTSELVRFTLENVVAKGTGRNAYIENYRVGGKTGTAQKVKNGIYMVGNYIVSFIGFMPADNPKIVVYVAIDNPKGITQYGGTVAAPIAKNILKDAINVLDIKKSKDVIPKEYNWMDTKYKQVPDVVGKNVNDAKNILKGFTVEYSGNGENVIYQSPDANTYVKENGTIKLMLD